MTKSPLVAAHAPLTFQPKFFQPTNAYTEYTPNIEGAYQEGIAYAKQKGLRTAQALMKAGIANAMMLTDLQGDFRDHGRLPVTGTDNVVLRMCVRLLNGTAEEHFTGVMFSLDGHPVNHISYGYYWRDRDGNPLDLTQRKAACLTLVDENKAVFKAYGFQPDGTTIDLGYYQAKYDPKDTVVYWKHLQSTGQGDIWVFAQHCTLGTDGVNLHPLLAETIAFMSGARALQPMIISKGHIAGTDWFGPLQPCRPDPSHPQGGLQTEALDFFQRFGTVEFCGVAEDFCDFHMKAQVMANLPGTAFFPKMRFLQDGTAPIVPNSPHVKEQNERAHREGVIFINHDATFEKAA